MRSIDTSELSTSPHSLQKLPRCRQLYANECNQHSLCKDRNAVFCSVFSLAVIHLVWDVVIIARMLRIFGQEFYTISFYMVENICLKCLKLKFCFSFQGEKKPNQEKEHNDRWRQNLNQAYSQYYLGKQNVMINLKNII